MVCPDYTSPSHGTGGLLITSAHRVTVPVPFMVMHCVQVLFLLAYTT